MEPRAFLQLAQQLSNKTTCEASLRTCISRSYYALFNLMVQFVDKNIGGLSWTANDHKKIYRYFNNCGIEDVEKIASDLNDLRDDRNDSDYKLHLDRFKDQTLVTFTFIKARRAFNSFEELLQNSKKRNQIVKAIREYKKITNS